MSGSSSSSTAAAPKDDKDKDKAVDKADKKLEFKCLCCRDTQKLICPASEEKSGGKCLNGLVIVKNKHYAHCPICVKGLVRCIACTKCPTCNDDHDCSTCNGTGLKCRTCGNSHQDSNDDCSSCGREILDCRDYNGTGTKKCAECDFSNDDE